MTGANKDYYLDNGPFLITGPLMLRVGRIILSGRSHSAAVVAQRQPFCDGAHQNQVKQRREQFSRRHPR